MSFNVAAFHFLILTTGALKVHHSTKDRFKHASGLRHQADSRIAAAFGGGGCFSALSQMGYFRGLLSTSIVETIDSDGNVSRYHDSKVEMTTFGSTSGGSWGLGMAFASDQEGGFLDTYLDGTSKRAQVTYNRKEKVFENQKQDGMGKWCMFPILHAGLPRDKWAAEMAFCGGCAKTGKCSLKKYDELFGAASNCMAQSAFKALDPSYQVSGSLLQTDFMTNDTAMWTMPDTAHQLQFKSYEEQVYSTFFKNLGVAKDKKLSDFETPFRNGTVKWSMSWAHVHRENAPFIAMSFKHESTGPIGPIGAQKDQELIPAETKSSDAMSGLINMYLVQAIENAGPGCDLFTGLLGTMTERKLYPFPFEPVPADLYQKAGPLGVEDGIQQEAWDADGMLTDVNAIGETIVLMEDSPPERRPTMLVSAITGFLNNNVKYSAQQVIGYFKEKVPYSMLWSNFASEKTLLNNSVTNCQLGEMDIYNPTYFFSLYSKSLSKYITDDVPAECTKELYVSFEPSRECWNMAYQAIDHGTIFVRDVLVVRNPFFGIKGGWEVGVLFSILAKNAESEKWVEAVYGDTPTEIQRLRDFPILADSESQLMGLKDARDGFALMNYNAYKGYMTMCFITYFYSHGEQKCSYCVKRSEECEGWLPKLKFKRD